MPGVTHRVQQCRPVSTQWNFERQSCFRLKGSDVRRQLLPCHVSCLLSTEHVSPPLLSLWCDLPIHLAVTSSARGQRGESWEVGAMQPAVVCLSQAEKPSH
jgi:hypothetical protein